MSNRRSGRSDSEEKKPAPEASGPPDRHALLESGTSAVSDAWIDAWRKQLVKEERPIRGGWPGTMPEAQARVREYFSREWGRNLPALTESELGWATKATYTKARRGWLACAEKGE